MTWKNFFRIWLESNSMMVGTVLHWYCQRGIQGLCSVWDGPLSDNIYLQAVVTYYYRELSLGGSGCPNSTSGHYAAKFMLCCSFLLVLSVCYSPHPIRFQFQNQVFCRIMNWLTNFHFNFLDIRSLDYIHLLLWYILS